MKELSNNSQDRRFRAPAPPTGLDALDGILVVDKPSGPTSHDIVAMIRRHFSLRKVGHGGTLDPQATGVLIILLGRGTKLSSIFVGSDKAYKGEIHLGIATTSQDAQGDVIKEGDCSHVTREQLQEEMDKFTGDILQKPPMVSAVKIDGVPLYKRARKGQVVERKERLIHIYEYTLDDFHPPKGNFFVRCTKGTYVRSLCADVGEALGCGAHLSALRRTQSGKFSIKDALALDDILSMSREELEKVVVPIHKFSTHGVVG